MNAQNGQRGHDYETENCGNEKRAAETRKRALAPGNERSDAGEKQQKQGDGYVDAIVIRRVDGFLFAAEGFHDDRKERSPQHGEATGEQNDVVEQETRF